MSEALYRKYRPQTFDDVVGQTHIERTLKNAIESDRVSHAYLFCGPRGTGKTTTARLLAKALLCEGGPTPCPDGTCEQCLAIAEGTHPDVNELDAASRTGVQNVRDEIIGRVQFAPTRGRYKIYIIDEVHMLSVPAFNALLKTLEEPPEHVVFILCTTDPQQVLETIRSRCQRFDFHRLSNEEIISRLGAVCTAEGVQFEGDALDLIAHRSQGGMRDALTTLEQLIAFGGGRVTLEVARNVLGELDSDGMEEIVGHIARRDAAACFTWVASYIETGADLAQFTRDLASYVRDLYVIELAGDAVSVDAESASRERMAAAAASFGADRLAYVLRVLGDLSSELRSSANARLSFEIALTRMVRPESDLTLESLAARIADVEMRLAQMGAGAAATSPAQAPVASAAAPAFAASAVPGVASVRPAATVPAASAGYKAPITHEAPPSVGQRAAQAAAAMGKAAAARAQVEQHRGQAVSRMEGGASVPASAARPEAPMPAAAPVSASAPSRPQASACATQAAPASSAAPAPHSLRPVSDAPAPAGEASPERPSFRPDASVSDGVRAKLSNPAALQRGWQAALAELKRQRAVYAALMQSARVVARPDGDGIAVEFSRENDFAFSAAQKPDVSAALDAALRLAFGGFVPFAFTQGDGVAAAVMAARPSRPVEATDSASAPRRPLAPSVPPSRPAAPAAPHRAPDAPSALAHPYGPSDDDMVPYTDADAASYLEDADYGAPWDVPAPPASAPGASAASCTPAQAGLSDSASEARRPDAASSPSGDAAVSEPMPEPAGAASGAAQFDAGAIAPVDPYAAGKRLGFDSMPNPKKRPKGTVVATGWPGVGGAKAQTPDAPAPAGRPAAAARDASVPAATSAVQDAPATAPAAEGAASAFGPASAVPAPEAASALQPAPHAPVPQEAPAFAASASGPALPDAAPPLPAVPNPFASRRMPRGIGGTAQSAVSAAPAAGSGEEMGIEDIFGAFGVSMDGVKEER